MRTIKCQNLNDASNKLQKYVDQRWHSNPLFGGRRLWLKAIPEDSYGLEDYRIELWVLEGTPIKQIVIIDHYRKQICCFESNLRRKIRFVWDLDQ